ncbi:hypothetical protein ACOME3_004918 [Neoechinorhynchus agilis]
MSSRLQAHLLEHGIKSALRLGPIGALIKRNIEQEYIRSLCLRRGCQLLSPDIAFSEHFKQFDKLLSSSAKREGKKEAIVITSPLPMHCHLTLNAPSNDDVFWRHSRFRWWRKLLRYHERAVQSTKGVFYDSPQSEAALLESFDTNESRFVATLNVDQVLDIFLQDAFDQDRLHLHHRIAPFRFCVIHSSDELKSLKDNIIFKAGKRDLNCWRGPSSMAFGVGTTFEVRMDERTLVDGRCRLRYIETLTDELVHYERLIDAMSAFGSSSPFHTHNLKVIDLLSSF